MEVRLDMNSLLQFYDLAECVGDSFAHKLRTGSLRISDLCFTSIIPNSRQMSPDSYKHIHYWQIFSKSSL